METKEFTLVHLGHLTIEDVFSLNKSTVEYAIPVKESIGELPKAILALLETDNNAMGVQMNKALKSVLTPQLTEMRTDRENRFAEIKRNVTTDLKGSDPEKKAAAENMEIFLRPYWNFHDKAMNTQTGILSELFGKYNESEPLKTFAAILGITELMAGLEKANAGFGTLYQSRDQEGAATESPSASSHKATAVKTYTHFCASIELAVNYTPSDALTTLFKQLDELRKAYARLANTKTKAAKVTPAVVK
jgi:hypothetical protein